MSSTEHRQRNPQRVFQLTYVSRATERIPADGATALVQEAAENNLENSVSGVLYSEKGVFLQWLEGPAEAVCSLMSRISRDPRHGEISVLNAGWRPERRFPGWPMHLAERLLPDEASTTDRRYEALPACNAESASRAFEEMAVVYQRQENRQDLFPPAQSFAEGLALCAGGGELQLPGAALGNVRMRAQFVDDVCRELAQGVAHDLYNSLEAAIGVAQLNHLWQRAGRVPDPIDSRRCVAVVVPQRGCEVLGAVVKSDLLRASGVSVRTVIEDDFEATLRALGRFNFDAAIVTGSRIGARESVSCGEGLTVTMRERWPATPTFLGGASSGPICAWPHRVAQLRHGDGVTALSTADIDWRLLSALASLSGL